MEGGRQCATTRIETTPGRPTVKGDISDWAWLAQCVSIAEPYTQKPAVLVAPEKRGRGGGAFKLEVVNARVAKFELWTFADGSKVAVLGVVKTAERVDTRRRHIDTHCQINVRILVPFGLVELQPR